MQRKALFARYKREMQKIRRIARLERQFPLLVPVQLKRVQELN